MMVIYKFGGASVKDAAAFHLMKNIVTSCNEPLIVVVSAMGKTTNRLENIARLGLAGGHDYLSELDSLKAYHIDIVKSLINDPGDPVYQRVEGYFAEIEKQIEGNKALDFNLYYDQVVSFGEVISTTIVSRFLQLEGLANEWVDIRPLLITDENYRDATVDFQESATRIGNIFRFDDTKIYVTQGFIGSATNGKTTTLGREGSDFTAAILANILNGQHLTLWKDVEGIYNADPALFDRVSLLESVSYQEMIELAYYGAKVIHPKTIKPLRQKQIPLLVKSFYHPGREGTRITEVSAGREKIPITILKQEQVLISISLEDLSFISESHISRLFSLLYRFRLKANLMQHSAVSFSVVVDEPRGREVLDLISILRREFKVLYNDKLTLSTVRHYTDDSILAVTSGKKIYLEQRSRGTAQYLTD